MAVNESETAPYMPTVSTATEPETRATAEPPAQHKEEPISMLNDKYRVRKELGVWVIPGFAQDVAFDLDNPYSDM